jgi:ribA/ribD-fused uncharacterized protein
MPLFPDIDADAVFFSRKDSDELLGSFIELPFELDGRLWPTAEHYCQAMKFEGSPLADKVHAQPSAKLAQKLGESWLNKLKARKDWGEVRTTVMTRAVYIQARSHSDKAEAILATGESPLMENDNYDYFWGCGRDRRGENQYGKVVMNVRAKLRQEAAEEVKNG